MSTETYSDSAETARLVDRAASGDRSALSDLLAKHAEQLRLVVRRRLGRRSARRIDPSDVMQDAQKSAIERFDDYCLRRPMPFRLWLLKTAHERIVDAERAHLHAEKRSVNRELALPDGSSLALAQHLLATAPGPLESALRGEVARQIRRCLAQLSERDRGILMLRCFEGLDNRDAAAVLEIEPEAAKKRFARALMRMRGRLQAAGLGGD